MIFLFKLTVMCVSHILSSLEIFQITAQDSLFVEFAELIKQKGFFLKFFVYFIG